MSSYTKKLKHPVTGKEQVALCIDDYYSRHVYGYGFKKDGTDADIFKTKHEECDFFHYEEIETNPKEEENKKVELNFNPIKNYGNKTTTISKAYKRL